MQLTRIILVLFLFGGLIIEGADAPPAKTRPISLTEAIDLALKHNIDLQVQRFNPTIAQYSLSLSYGGYDPNFFASAQHQYSLSPGGIDAQSRTFQGNETEIDSFRAGIAGLTPIGLTYSLSTSLSDVYGNRPGSFPDFSQIESVDRHYVRDGNGNLTGDFFTTTNFVSIPLRIPFESTTGNAVIGELRQHLLKDFWIDSTRANIQISRNRLKHSEQVLRFQIMQTINSVEQAYYNLIFARESVKVQEKALELVERSLVETRKKVEVGALAQLEEKQAESQVATSKADLLAAQRSLALQENVLKGLLTDSYASWNDVSLLPAENLIAVPASLNLQESWQKGMSLRPDLLQAKLDLQRSELNERFDKNQLFPQLDLVGQYGYAGSGKEFSGALANIGQGSNPFYYFGAEVRYPLGNRTARNNYKISQAQKEQTRLLLEKKKQEIMIQIDDAIKLAQTDFQRVGATGQARIFAEAALDAEQKKLENGKSTPFFVLQFQRNVTAARFEEIRALAEYNNALAQLAFLEGATLERHRINFSLK